jgi:hypothetical protein
MLTLTVAAIGLMLLYIAWMHIQLYISRRVIATLRQTSIKVSQAQPSLDPRPILAGLGGLVLLGGLAFGVFWN